MVALSEAQGMAVRASGHAPSRGASKGSPAAGSVAAELGCALPKVGVGAVVWRGRDVLLVKRLHPPRQHEWSLPAGKQEAGETLRETVTREVFEETGVVVDVLGLIDVVDAIFRDDAGALQYHYTIIDFSARWVSGDAHPASDAAEVAWVPFDALGPYDIWERTERMILDSARRHGPLAPVALPGD